MSPIGVGAEVRFPDAVQGWTLSSASETYTPENLYRYIDGASELYISYGFVQLLTRRYQRQDQPEIVVDFFDMGSADNAFGIFAHSQEKPDRKIGHDSEYLDGLLRFWKGRYYVSLLAGGETPEAQAAVLALGHSLAAAIPESGARPRWLKALPAQGLIAASIRFFSHPAWLNSYRFIANDNVLEIGSGCRAVLAKYEEGSERPVVLLVFFPESAAAIRALAGLASVFNLPPGADKTVILKDQEHFAAAVEKKALFAVWHGGGHGPAQKLLARLRDAVKVFDEKT